MAPPVSEDLPLGYIATIAGTGVWGYNGDEIPAIEAQLNQPRRIALDGQGNLYIGDAANERIRYIDLSGMIHTFAGTGNSGYNGDGIPAKEADLNNPRGIAVDIPNNIVYISEGLGNRIRRVDRNGIIHTYAGTGEPTEDRNDPSYNGDEKPATEAKLSYPYGLTLDRQGNLYIADMSNHRVRMIDTSGIIYTVAGTGEPGYNGDGILAIEAQLNRPGGVAVDSHGILYIADALNNRIRKVDKNGMIYTIAGTGETGYNGDKIPATEATLWLPRDVAVDQSGVIFIADSSNDRVRVILKNGMIQTIAGTGKKGYNGDQIPAGKASLWNPRGVAIDFNGNLYIADKFNARIRFILLNSPPPE
jgi:sugar lactone lactonase YvrE